MLRSFNFTSVLLINTNIYFFFLLRPQKYISICPLFCTNILFHRNNLPQKKKRFDFNNQRYLETTSLFQIYPLRYFFTAFVENSKSDVVQCHVMLCAGS